MRGGGREGVIKMRGGMRREGGHWNEIRRVIIHG